MKKLFCVLALLVLPIVAFAGDARDIVLTSDGTLFIAESHMNEDYTEADSSVMAYITLTIRRGEETKRFIVPGSLNSGVHKNPALAYDDGTKTLFVFWQRSGSLLHSELFFQSLSEDEQWSPATTFGNGRNMRENLRIAVTRRADAPSEEGGTILVPQVNVHAVWWETDTHDGQQSAQYAMLAVEEGQVVESTIVIQSLYAFANPEEAAFRFVPATEVPEAFKHPAIFASPRQDEILAIFGEVRDDSFNRVTIRPSKIVGNARVHIPVGRSGGAMPSPKFAAANNAVVGTIVGAADAIALYSSDETALRFIVHVGGKWSETRTLPLDKDIQLEVAINAVRRLIQHE
jgi:hypothetical protein